MDGIGSADFRRLFPDVALLSGGTALQLLGHDSHGNKQIDIVLSGTDEIECTVSCPAKNTFLSVAPCDLPYWIDSDKIDGYEIAVNISQFRRLLRSYQLDHQNEQRLL